MVLNLIGKSINFFGNTKEGESPVKTHIIGDTFKDLRVGLVGSLV